MCNVCNGCPDRCRCTLYRLVDYNLFTARNIDLPRKVRYARRKPKKQYKVNKTCRIGRTCQDFLNFMEQNPDLPITQMDSVEGTKGGKVLLGCRRLSPNDVTLNKSIFKGGLS